MTPAPGVHVVVMRTLAAEGCVGPAASVVTEPAHWLIPVAVVPDVRIVLGPRSVPGVRCVTDFPTYLIGSDSALRRARADVPLESVVSVMELAS